MSQVADNTNYSTLAAELVRAIRGRRTQSGLSRRIGYASNIVHRWESQQCSPSAARFLQVCEGLGVDIGIAYGRLLRRPLTRTERGTASSPEGVAALLAELRGRTPIIDVATATGVNRFTVSKWLRARAQPNLPNFLQMVEATSGRLLDFLGALCDPATLPSVAVRWRRMEAARQIAYEEPWSHAVLRALQLDRAPTQGDQATWIAKRLDLAPQEVTRLLHVLRDAGQVRRVRARWKAHSIARVDTSSDPVRARVLKAQWIRTAADRLEAGVAGGFAYSLCEVSRADFERMRQLQLGFARAMQSIIAASQGTERVALFSAQLLDLGARPTISGRTAGDHG